MIAVDGGAIADQPANERALAAVLDKLPERPLLAGDRGCDLLPWTVAAKLSK